MNKSITQMNGINCKHKKKSYLVFKVDYEKAYDSVSWKFLEYMF